MCFIAVGRNMVSVNFISSIGKSVKSAYNRMPSVVVKKDNIINGVAYIGRKWTSPQQRLILGANPNVMQPYIDLKNNHVDDKNRKG